MSWRLTIATAQLLVFFVPGLMAQNVADTIPQKNVDFVRWVSEYPARDKTKKEGIFKRIGNFMFGKPVAVLANPMAVYANNSEEYWVLDQKSNTIALIEEQKGESLKPKAKVSDYPSSLVGMCRVPDLGFLITDSRNGRVYLMATDGKWAKILNDSLKLEQPTGLAYSPTTGEVWVLETKKHRVVVLTQQGEIVKTIGNRGNQAGEFNYPTHIWIDSEGKVYIVDSMNFRVQIYNSDGTWESMFGKAGDATGYFARPKGIATDSHGNIYVADALFHTVQIFNSQGHFLYNFGTQGRKSGEFWLPNGIYIDSNDYIYVADSYNSRVQIFQLINHD